MKLNLLLVLFLSGTIIFAVDQMDYISDYDREIIPSSWYYFEGNENGDYYIYNINFDEGHLELFCDKDGNTLWYKKWYPDGSLFHYGIQREGYVECQYYEEDGEFITKNVNIESDYWYQSVGPQLPKFIDAEEESRVFTVIDFENMKSYNMMIELKLEEIIEIDGNKYNSIYTELRFTGFLRGFWLGRLWFDSCTGSYVKFLGKLRFFKPPAYLYLVNRQIDLDLNIDLLEDSIANGVVSQTTIVDE